VFKIANSGTRKKLR